MGVPFAPMPTWGQFLAIARAQKVVLRKAKNQTIDGPRGGLPPIRYLKKGSGPEVIVPAMKGTDIMSPILLASLCRAIPVDPSPFGFTLDDLPPVEFPSWP
jgi:hypothetical protein